MNATLTEVADALLGAPEPVLLLLDADGLVLSRPLGTGSPADILDALGPDEGRGWHAVAMMVEGQAVHLDTGEPLGRLVMALAISRDDAACIALMPDGVMTTPPTIGRIPDAVRAFLG